MSCLYIFNINSLIDNITCKYFLPLCRLSFSFVCSFLCCAKTCKLDYVIFFSFAYFCFYFYCPGRLTQENTGTIYVREGFAYVLFNEFMISCLMFKSLSHLEFISIHGESVYSNLIDLQLFQHLLLKRPSFSHFIFLSPLLKINWLRVCVHFWFIYVYFCANATLF